MVSVFCVENASTLSNDAPILNSVCAVVLAISCAFLEEPAIAFVVALSTMRPEILFDVLLTKLLTLKAIVLSLKMFDKYTHDVFI
jgi:hypothetical protein